MDHRGSCSRRSPTVPGAGRRYNHWRPTLHRSRVNLWRCGQRCMHRILPKGHAPPARLPRPTPRFAGMQAAASSWRLGWRNHEAAWSRRLSPWCQQASRVAAVQTAQRLLPEAWDCRRQVRSGRPEGPTTASCKVFEVEQCVSLLELNTRFRIDVEKSCNQSASTQDSSLQCGKVDVAFARGINCGCNGERHRKVLPPTGRQRVARLLYRIIIPPQPRPLFHTAS